LAKVKEKTMANKKNLGGILAVALVFGVFFTACPMETEEGDTWSKVTTLDQLNGTWKGSYSQTKTIREYMEGNGGTWNDAMATTYGDMKVTTSAEMTMTINASAKTQSQDMKMTMAYSGGNIDTLWATLKTAMGSGSGVTVNDSNHSITMTYSSSATTMTEAQITSMLDRGLEINQNGTKLKSPADDESGTPEIIFTKQ
jgi:hypothetical protein